MKTLLATVACAAFAALAVFGGPVVPNPDRGSPPLEPRLLPSLGGAPCRVLAE